jgi:hypothetical protein
VVRRGPKSDFAIDIINTIRNMDPPGRFLEFNEKVKCWEEAPMARMIDKICQALRSTKWSDPSTTGHAEPIAKSSKQKSPNERPTKAPSKSPAKRKKYLKHPMICRVSVRLPSAASLAELGLPDSSIMGPPRLEKHEGSLIKQPHIHDVLFGRGPTFTTHQGNVQKVNGLGWYRLPAT